MSRSPCSETEDLLRSFVEDFNSVPDFGAGRYPDSPPTVENLSTDFLEAISNELRTMPRRGHQGSLQEPRLPAEIRGSVRPLVLNLRGEATRTAGNRQDEHWDDDRIDRLHNTAKAIISGNRIDLLQNYNEEITDYCMHLIGLRLPDTVSVALIYLATGRENDIMNNLFRQTITETATVNLPDQWKRLAPSASKILHDMLCEADIRDQNSHEFYLPRPSTLGYILQISASMRRQLTADL